MTPTTLAAVLGAALAAAPDPQDKAKTVEERLTAIEAKLARIAEAVEGKKDRDGYPSTVDRGAVAELKDLKDDVAKLKTQLDAMKTTTALRPAADAMAGKGTVRIENGYPVEVTVAVNATTHRIAAGANLEVTVPAGAFTFQLLSGDVDLALKRGTVEEKKTATLRVK